MSRGRDPRLDPDLVDQPGPPTCPRTLAGPDRRRRLIRAHYASLDGVLADGEVLELCRLRYGASASRWGFAIYRASHNDYPDSYLPSGHSAGTPEDALYTACGLYLCDPTAWT